MATEQPASKSMTSIFSIRKEHRSTMVEKLANKQASEVEPSFDH